MKLFNRFSLVIVGVIFTGFAYADALNLSPSPQDVSVVFLSNIFGVVDGVLSGTGSQIVGAMFGIFNSAVLALGGIVLTYTLMVSTMNTAHEGQMLGQKWSSIWIPVRSTVGISLLLPKTSGYCVMQIFIMWVVVQGVGAADRVWEAALSYLNRGGVIVTKNVDPSTLTGKGNNTIINAASGMLVGQACMLTMQRELETFRESQVSQAQTNQSSGITSTVSSMCTKDSSGNYQGVSGMNSDEVKIFCTNSVPDFVNSVDLASSTILKNSGTGTSGTTSVAVPNFNEGNKVATATNVDELYSKLNGICGSIKWNNVDISDAQSSGLSSSEVKTVNQSRPIAMMQMYSDLSAAAQVIVNDSPEISGGVVCTPLASGSTFNVGSPTATSANSDNGTEACVASPYVRYGFGQVLTSTGGSDCDSYIDSGFDANSTNACKLWGSPSGSTYIMTGMELQQAVLSYTGLMSATNNLQKGGDDAASDKQLRGFITNAKQEGWFMAGSYFFNLALLNMSSTQGATGSDSGASVTGLPDNNTYDTASTGTQAQCTSFLGNDEDFCTKTLKESMQAIIGYNTAVASIPLPVDNSKTGKNNSLINRPDSVYGYLYNASRIVLPGQQGMTAPTFEMKFDFNPSSQVPQLPKASFSGGAFGIPGVVTTFMYNNIVRYVFNLILGLIMPIINQLFFMMVSPIILLFTGVFASAVKMISDPMVNPIIALANMGSMYINGVMSQWVIMAGMAAGAAMLGPAPIALIMIVMPIVGAWMTIMVGVGLMCAYYVPFLPYMLFLFGGIGWFIGVIEAMVAAPIVALGITHPEGHDAFGKGEQAFNLLLNVFMRPAMMILGFIFGIILSYVGVWAMNAGFQRTLTGIGSVGAISTAMQGNDVTTGMSAVAGYLVGGLGGAAMMGGKTATSTYGQWTGLFLYFFSILIYTTMYVAIVQKAFSLIHYLPDKVLRWLSGGMQESLGGEVAAEMGRETKGKIEEGAKATGSGMAKGSGEGGKKLFGDPDKKGGDSSSQAESTSSDGDSDGSASAAATPSGG